MNRGVAATSPSASRMRLMALFRPRSKSTNVLPAQILVCSCSLVTNWPGRSSSAASTSKGWSCSLTLMPRFLRSRAVRSTSKQLKRIGDDGDIGAGECGPAFAFFARDYMGIKRAARINLQAIVFFFGRAQPDDVAETSEVQNDSSPQTIVLWLVGGPGGRSRP